MKTAFNRPRAGRLAQGQHGVALVITLLLLSVITFLAIAFLALTQRNRSAVTTTVDSATAQMMAQSAQARAQAEIIARMMANTDLLNYDYLASHNYISPYFTNAESGIFDPNNVNYDRDSSLNPVGGNQKEWEQNIANLWYDPRPPVFVPTNPAQYPASNDFRFWIDLNENGYFETNGLQTVFDNTGNPAKDTSGNIITSWFNGEPEWIGVLRNPLYPHSPTNPFIGRYAYMVLPIGKTLDANFIHNISKSLGFEGPTIFAPSGNTSDTQSYDGYIRDQGVGPWELNLAAYLEDLNTNIYYNNLPLGEMYHYNLPESVLGGITTPENQGLCFNDAWSILYYRYGNPVGVNSSWLPGSLAENFGTPAGYTVQNLFSSNGIDEYGLLASTAGNQPYLTLSGYANYANYLKNASDPWPGSYNTNMYFDIEDLLNGGKTSIQFTNRLLTNMGTPLVGGRYTGEVQYDRDTFQRLLETMGTGSAPEYGTFVYSNGLTFLGTNGLLFYVTNLNFSLQLSNSAMGVIATSSNVATRQVTTLGFPTNNTYPTWLRTKVNLNYDNTYQITNGPFTAASTNLTNWGPLTFFTNAADLLLRSQEYPITNSLAGVPYFVGFNHFGVTNIPIYNSANPGIFYNAQIHRMLQLAANIYQDVSPNMTNVNGRIYQLPYVFRPLFSPVIIDPSTRVQSIYITNYELMTPVNFNRWLSVLTQNPFYTFAQLTNASTYPGYPNAPTNVCGIPWVVGAVKDVPSFNRVYSANYTSMVRNLIFFRTNPKAGGLPNYTNEFYEMFMTNVFGLDAWNSSRTNYNMPVSIYATNSVTYIVTNNAPAPYSYAFTTNFSTNFITNMAYWKYNAFVPMFMTNWSPVPLGYYSPYRRTFTNLTGLVNNVYAATYLGSAPQDLKQSVWQEFDWSVIVSNSMMYYLVDSANHNVLDFVNLGPVVISNNITAEILTNAQGQANLAGGVNNGLNTGAGYWQQTVFPTGIPTGIAPSGVLAQITGALAGPSPNPFASNFFGTVVTNCFGPPSYPIVVLYNTAEFVADDPLVHYTLDDLTWPGNSYKAPTPQFALGQFGSASIPIVNTPVTAGLTNNVGITSARYQPWYRTPGSSFSMQDPGISSSDAWEFPTNRFPSVGWLGRVHRGTPWQTVYFKANPPVVGTWTNASQPGCQNNPYTIPGPNNDWNIVDLFTTAPNDNAARGLLSVNQTNTAAWAAVLGGVITLTNSTSGFPLDPFSQVPAIVQSINSVRPTNEFGQALPFHSIGQILAAPGLTTSNAAASSWPGGEGMTPDYDHIIESIPQQTLGLLKVGLPQFVIYSWGQSLRPRNVDVGPVQRENIGLVTNYDITGEFETRTVCHVVGDPYAQHPKIVIDSFNIEPSN